MAPMAITPMTKMVSSSDISPLLRHGVTDSCVCRGTSHIVPGVVIVLFKDCLPLPRLSGDVLE